MNSSRFAALAAAIITGVVLTSCSGATETERDDDGAVTERNDDASVFDIQLGDCYNFPSGATGEVETLTAVPCDEPHEAEAFHESEIEGDEFPGAAEVEKEAETECVTAFDSFVGLSYEESTLDFTYLTPTQETWDQLDDRLISCLVTDPATSEVTGSRAPPADPTT